MASASQRCHFRLRLGAGVLLVPFACSSGHWEQPEPDPELVAAARAQQTREAEQRQAVETARAEREQRVFALSQEEPTRALSVEDFYDLLGHYCGQCHLPVGMRLFLGSREGLYVDDVEELIQIGKIVPGDGDASRLVLRMRQGDMPPVQRGAPVPTSLIDRIADFIDRLPTPDLLENNEQP
jgi:hypothetical protein